MEPDRERQLLDEIARRDERIALLERENELLRQKLDLVIRKLFGVKSEKLDPSQLELLLGDDPAKKPEAAGDAPAAELSTLPLSKVKRGNVRKPRLPEHLPVEESVLDPEPVKACPAAWRCIGSEVTEQLDYRPGRFLRRRLIRRKYVRVADKYAWHQPLYRQESIFLARHGVTISRQTMNWEALAAGWLKPLHRLLQEKLLAAGYLQADETAVRYLEPGNGKTKTGYFWVYRARDGTLLYDWRPSRAHDCLDHVLYLEHPGQEPRYFQGILQCDGYAAYETWRGVAAQRGQIVELAACWAMPGAKLTKRSRTRRGLPAGCCARSACYTPWKRA